MEEEIKTKQKINPVSLVGGALLIISGLFLPWISAPFLGGLKLLDIQRLINQASSMARAFGSNVPAQVSIASTLVLIILILVLVAGALSTFRPKIGGVIGTIALIIFTIGMGKYLSYADSGYYMAWIGAIVSLFSNKIYKRIS